MTVQRFVKRRPEVVAIQWMGTQQCRENLAELLHGQPYTMTIDGGGDPWLAVEGQSMIKVPADFWIVRDGMRVGVLSPRDFSAVYEVMAP